MHFKIGYYENTADGMKWQTVRQINRDTDAEAEAEIDCLAKETPPDLDGNLRRGLFIKRGSKEWFRRFSCHAVR